MMTKPLIVLVMIFLPWLPWTDEAFNKLKSARVIFAEEVQGGRGTCCGQEPSITIGPTCEYEDLPMVVLHETQHLLPGLYNPKLPTGEYDYFGHFDKWGGFLTTAIQCVKETDYDRLKDALKFAKLGPWQLHAQLPWLLRGKLCSKLQPWYSWFDLRDTSP